MPSRTTPGLYQLFALGGTGSGLPIPSDPVSIDVECPGLPQKISISLGPSLDLSVGERDMMRVFGTYADGRHVDLTRSTQTKYEAEPPGIASVRDGLITALSVGSTKILVDRQVVLNVLVKPGAR